MEKDANTFEYSGQTVYNILNIKIVYFIDLYKCLEVIDDLH